MQTESDYATRPGAFWRVVEIVMVGCFIGMLAVMFVQVASRYAFGIGVPWTDETSRFLFIGEIYLGAAIAQRYASQIRITVLLDVVPPNVRRICEGVSDILVAAISLGLAWGSWGMIDRTMNVMASTLPISFAVLYGVQGIGIVMVAVLALRDAWFKFARHGEATS